MGILDPQQLLDHVNRAGAAPARAVVHRLSDEERVAPGRGGLAGEVALVLSSAPSMVFSLSQVLKRVRDTAQPNDVNSILHKLVMRKKVKKGKVDNGVRKVNGYQWTEKKGKP